MGCTGSIASVEHQRHVDGGGAAGRRERQPARDDLQAALERGRVAVARRRGDPALLVDLEVEPHLVGGRRRIAALRARPAAQERLGPRRFAWTTTSSGSVTARTDGAGGGTAAIRGSGCSCWGSRPTAPAAGPAADRAMERQAPRAPGPRAPGPRTHRANRVAPRCQAALPREHEHEGGNRGESPPGVHAETHGPQCPTDRRTAHGCVERRLSHITGSGESRSPSRHFQPQCNIAARVQSAAVSAPPGARQPRDRP